VSTPSLPILNRVSEIRIANNSPNTIGAAHWKHEFLQKESIKKAITHLQDEDIVFIGDVDEIWNPHDILYYQNGEETEKLKLAVYVYYLNNLSDEHFWGPIVGRYGWIQNTCLNHLRTNAKKTKGEYGWHFTSMAAQLRKKLTDSYTEESYATPAVLAQLEDNIKKRKDFLGRDFKYKITEEGWPSYLKENKLKYQHLIYEG